VLFQNIYFICFAIFPLLSFVATFLCINPIKKLSLKYGFYDAPSSRKSHRENIVRLGGLAIYIGVFFSLFFIHSNKPILDKYLFSNPLENTFIIKIFIGSSIFFVLGIFDDLFRLSPFVRLFIQFLTVIILGINGLLFNEFNFIPLNYSFTLSVPINISLIIHALWISGITNAINWLDGLDGLTAICVSFILATLAIISFSKGLFFTPLILIIIIFSILAFYKFNKYPAKIIMGDGGSYFLGFVLSTFSIMISSYKGQSFSLFIPILVLLIPILDMVYVLFLRFINGKSIFLPDRSHIHHRLIDKGYSYQNTIHIISLLVFSTSLITLIINQLIY
jgi:UDP-N-acetylmuramyl pentapeptide phosphotransferase/UDP-N-acetylglucosamine-1-phosphate transferase